MPEIHRDRLREKADQRELTVGQLAKAARCSEDHIRSILAGRRHPSITVARSLAAAVDYPVAELIAGLESVTPLRRRRLAVGQTPQEVAERAGISYPHLVNLETGKRTASARVLRDLANALGCRPADIDPQRSAA
jgi:transcriptional regulator with XRE-family HTH domain